MRLVAFCEAAADFRVASDLVDRVLRDGGPDWLAEVLDQAPEAIRVWRGDDDGRRFFVLRDLSRHVERLAVRVPQGHFDGKRGAADALMTRTALAIVRSLIRRGEAIDAVVVIRDLDDQPARKAGLDQAMAEARRWARFALIVGCANPKREAWVLCGFEPENPDEHDRLTELRRELGFHPQLEAHQLHAADEHARRSAKRVLRILADSADREQRCWQVTPLDTLRARGQHTGLSDYLTAVEAELLPLIRIGR